MCASPTAQRRLHKLCENRPDPQSAVRRWAELPKGSNEAKDIKVPPLCLAAWG